MPAVCILLLHLLAAPLTTLLAAQEPSRSSRARQRFVAALAFALAAAAAAWLIAVNFRQPPAPETLVTDRPVEMKLNGYVSSQSCRACHPDEYASWHRSYHRSMTQSATPASVLGRFDGQIITAYDRTFRLLRSDDGFWIDMVDPASDGAAQPPTRVRRKIVMTTGSHHMQAYWYATDKARKVGLAPLVYLIETGTWAPERSTFLRPPHGPAPPETAQWNQFCHQCHATGVEPRVKDLDAIDTRLAELGIACEACHGPGEEHTRRNHDPLRRYGLHVGTPTDPTIVNPSKLPARLASQVCGQCHSIGMPPTAEALEEWKSKGHPYRPGQDLAATRIILRGDDRSSDANRRLLAYNPRFLEEQFWSDGMVRVSGREYQGLLASPCYVHGDEAKGNMLSCLSCHSLHPGSDDPRPLDAWADDQLRPGAEGNAACAACHSSQASGLEQHTHHAAGSTGSVCYNCHMPYTTYGLLKAIRSHTISSPSVAASLATGRPNACDQCHLDRTLAWTADFLKGWYGQPRPELTDDQSSTAASILWTLQGDAGQRVLMAWSYGWSAAKAASGTDWMAGFLGALIEDPYDVVRFIARRSLQRLEGYGDVQFDYVGPPGELEAAVRLVMGRWTERMAQSAGGRPARPELLLGERGEILQSKWVRLFKSRNTKRLQLLE